MEFELPSLPKVVVLNSALIIAIFLGAIIAMVGFWQFLPFLLDEAIETKPQSELVVNFTYMSVVNVGEAWNVSGTAMNPSNETLRNIQLRIFSDGNVQGHEHTINTLDGGQSVSFQLYPEIKPSASIGEFTAQTVISVPDTLPAEYELEITIKPAPTPTATPTATPGECIRIEDISTYVVEDITKTAITNDGEVVNFVVCDDGKTAIFLTLDTDEFNGRFPGKEVEEITPEELHQSIADNSSGVGYGSAPSSMLGF